MSSTFNEDTVIIGHSLGGVFTLKNFGKARPSNKSSNSLSEPPIGVRPILNYDRDNSFSGFELVGML